MFISVPVRLVFSLVVATVVIVPGLGWRFDLLPALPPPPPPPPPFYRAL